MKKRLLIITLFLMLLFVLFGQTVYAKAQTLEYDYLVKNTADGFALYDGSELLEEKESFSEILDALCENEVRIYFENVTINEAVTLERGSYTFLGKISAENGITLEKNVSLLLSDVELSIKTDCLAIRGGSLTATNSILSGEATVLSLSDGAKVKICASEIKNASNYPTVINTDSELTLEEVGITNKFGYGVDNRGDLFLLGKCSFTTASYDVRTEKAISAASFQMADEKNLSIRYIGFFEKGSETPIMVWKDRKANKNISVTDADGREYSLTEFEAEELYTSVYLPYRVNYYLFGKKIESVNYLKGEKIIAPDLNMQDGFTLLGWYTDGLFENKFVFGNDINTDISLYGKCLLDPVEYSLSDMELIYDGKEHLVSFLSIDHALEGSYTFTWKNENDEIISKTQTFSVKNVRDSGKYRCIIGFSAGNFYTETVTPFITIKVLKKGVDIPAISPAFYTGRAIYPDVPLSEYYSFEEKAYYTAGEYYISFALTDEENLCWTDDGFTGNVKFEVKKAKNEWLTELTASEGYIWSEPVFKCKAKFGEVEYLYSEFKEGPFADEYPAKVGEYYVKAVVRENNNWGQLESEVLRFNILDEIATSIKPISYPKKLEYFSFETFEPDGMLLRVKFNSGREKNVGADECVFIYENADTFRSADRGIKVVCYGTEMVIPVSVKRIEYDINLTFTNKQVEYNGKYQTASYEGALPVGVDGIPLRAFVEGGGSGAGIYNLTLKFKSDSTEYILPQDLTATLEIIPCTRELMWENLTFVYDGGAKVPVAYYNDVYGAKIKARVMGAAVESGDKYIAEAVSDDKNYTFSNAKQNFIIEKADYDLSNVEWVVNDFVYDGNRKAVYLKGLPSGLSVVGYVNNSYVNAGEYIASAVLNYDEKNYNPPVVEPLNWKIEKGEYAIDGIKFLSQSYVYDGEYHYPKLVGEMPRGSDGHTLKYRFSRGARDVDDGSHKVIIDFYTESSNYKVPESIFAYVEILPRTIKVSWENTSLYYTGKTLFPSAVCDFCEVRVAGNGVGVGKYTATVTTKSNNYVIENNSVEYEIIRAENYWLAEPSDFEFYLGADISDCVKGLFGTTEYLFYEDENLKRPVEEITSEGVYYCRAYVSGNENYTELLSNTFKVKVLPREITDFTVKVKGGARFFAFDKIDDEKIEIFALYNNGKTERLSVSEVEVVYSSGEFLKAGTVELTFKYQNRSVVVLVEVEKADYDMSAVSWENTKAVYDGTPKSAILIGLPLGVSVLDYDLINAVNAGVYTLGATLIYDEENYNPPVLPGGELLIEKRGLTPSLKSDAVYNKQKHYPVSDSDLYFVRETEGFINVGEYFIEFELYDSHNYYLTQNTARFTVHPKEVAVSVFDSRVFIDGIREEYGCSILDPSVNFDELMIEYYVEGEEIFARTGNKNYTLKVYPGSIVKVSALSKGTLLWILHLAVLIIILCAVLLLFIHKRQKAFATTVGTRKSNKTENLIELSTKTEGIKVMPIGNLSVDVKQAEDLLTDSIAKTFIRKTDKVLETGGNKKCIVNVDTLSENFSEGDIININILKEKGLVSRDAAYLKVLARGTIDKALIVEANYFSLTAVKMIALTGGEIYKVITKKKKK